MILRNEVRPVSQVAQALSKLSQVVGKLEGSVNVLETSLAGEQRDMFGASNASNNNAVQNGVDTELVAQKIDLAIEKIEDVLSEGEEAHG